MITSVYAVSTSIQGPCERFLTGVLILIDEQFLDLVANFTVGSLDIVLGAAIVRHE